MLNIGVKFKDEMTPGITIGGILLIQARIGLYLMEMFMPVNLAIPPFNFL